MVDLPNENWIRSEQQSEWAVCLDQTARFYGWKMYECNGDWVSGQKLTVEEAEYALSCGPLRQHWPKFQSFLDHLKSTAPNGDAG